MPVVELVPICTRLVDPLATNLGPALVLFPGVSFQPEALFVKLPLFSEALAGAAASRTSNDNNTSRLARMMREDKNGKGLIFNLVFIGLKASSQLNTPPKPELCSRKEPVG
jgi:hypothetical protein